MKKPLLVSIIGGSGSGKTTIIEHIASSFDFTPSILSMDNYYFPKGQQIRDENGIWNFDLPSAFDMPTFGKDIESLLRGENVLKEEYIFEDFERESKFIQTNSSPLIIIEGIFVLYDEKVRNQVDFQIYIEANDQKRIERRLKRDSLSRGLTTDMINYQWENHVCPAHNKWVLPQKKNADFIIDNNESYRADLVKCVQKIQNKLEGIS